MRKRSVAHAGTPLTQAEVDSLPAGTQVVITWSGGNGPALWTIEFHPRVPGAFAVIGNMRHRIDFVGPAEPFTVVTLYQNDS